MGGLMGIEVLGYWSIKELVCLCGVVQRTAEVNGKWSMLCVFGSLRSADKAVKS